MHDGARLRISLPGLRILFSCSGETAGAELPVEENFRQWIKKKIVCHVIHKQICVFFLDFVVTFLGDRERFARSQRGNARGETKAAPGLAATLCLFQNMGKTKNEEEYGDQSQFLGAGIDHQ